MSTQVRILALVALCVVLPSGLYSQESKERPHQQRLDPPDMERFGELKRLSPKDDVWLDAKNKRVVLQGGVCLQKGPLELFACTHQWLNDGAGNEVYRGTKEYECHWKLGKSSTST